MRSGSATSGLFGLFFSTLLAFAPFSSLAADAPSVSSRPKLYDPAADGNVQIAEALKIAKAENKRLILKFGANW